MLSKAQQRNLKCKLEALRVNQYGEWRVRRQKEQLSEISTCCSDASWGEQEGHPPRTESEGSRPFEGKKQ